MPGKVAIDSGSGSGIDEINILRVHRFKLIHQLPLTAQSILLMIIFRQVEIAERQNFGLDLLVSLFFLESLGFKSQLALIIIVIKYGRLVLLAPGTLGGVMTMPEYG